MNEYENTTGFYYVARIGPVPVGYVTVVNGEKRYIASVKEMPKNGAQWVDTLDEGKLFVASIFPPEVRPFILWEPIA